MGLFGDGTADPTRTSTMTDQEILAYGRSDEYRQKRAHYHYKSAKRRRWWAMYFHFCVHLNIAVLLFYVLKVPTENKLVVGVFYAAIFVIAGVFQWWWFSRHVKEARERLEEYLI